jgi:asparagine synthetase B (glutamine-hydrolysing)
MCKIAILTKHDATKVESLTRSLWRQMSHSERDGFGVLYLSASGRLVAVRSSSPTLDATPPDYVEGFHDGAFVPSDGGVLMVHGRTATCGVSLENTHPIVMGQSGIIHNGIVHSKKYHNTETTCDSELLLHAWRSGGLDEVAAEVSGYYAFAVLSKRGGQRILDVVKDGRASLFAGDAFGGAMFGTTAELITTAGGKVIGRVTDNTAIRFVNGRHTATREFTPKAEPVNATVEKAAKKAFGSSMKDDEDGVGDWPLYRSTNWRVGM